MELSINAQVIKKGRNQLELIGFLRITILSHKRLFYLHFIEPIRRLRILSPVLQTLVR